MKTSFIVIGKTEEEALKSGLALYEKRLRHYLDFRLTELPAAKVREPGQQKTKEGETILKQVAASDTLILLDEKGKEFDSVGFAGFLQKQFNQSPRHLVFAAGGAHGFSEEVYKRANARLSLSKMTFPHQLVRLIFAEQLYRAMTILRNESYHHR